ncbi:MAG: hypothetical protein ACFFFB_11200, partial [Candidatus Heimdallarchaeota archaeon]
MFEWAPEELADIGQMIREGKYEESLQILEEYEESKKGNPQEFLPSYQFKCYIYLFQQFFEKFFEFAEKLYEASLRFNKPLLAVDSFLLRANVSFMNYNFEKGIEYMKQGEDLLNSLKNIAKIEKKRRSILLFHSKAMSLDPSMSPKSNIDLAIEHYKKSLNLAESLNDKDRIVMNLIRIAWDVGLFKGDLILGLEYIERAVFLAKHINFQLFIGWALLFKATLCHNRGEISRSLLLYKESLAIVEKIDYRFFIAYILNNMSDAYRMNGDLDLAIECSMKGIQVLSEDGNLRNIANLHDFLIQFLVEKGDLEQAQEYITRLKKLKNQLNNKDVDDIYRYNQALLLKESSRISNRGKAEEIFKEIIKDKSAHWEVNIRSLLSICELLLFELQLTGNSEVLEEIETYIAQLVNKAEQSHSYWIWGETYLLRAKLALISLDLKEARKLLSGGQKIAEKFGINLLAKKISNEHDILLKQLDKWEYLKKEDATLTERIKLAGLNEQMENMIKRRIMEGSDFSDEQPVLLLIVSEGGTPLFSQSFIEHEDFEDHLIGGFLSAFNSFVDEIFSGELDRASFGEHTLLINSLTPFFMCYIFKGQSYSAQHRLNHFLEKIKNDKEIWQNFEK